MTTSSLSIPTLSGSRPSLNEMVIESLSALQEDLSIDCATARQVTDFILKTHGIDYPIQTIIIVLNRQAVKGKLARRQHPGLGSRHRYCYYLNQSSQEVREEKILSRFKAFSNEFFQGDVDQALKVTRNLVEKFPSSD